MKRAFCQSGKFETSLFDDIKESFLSFRSVDGAIIIYFLKTLSVIHTESFVDELM